MVCTLLVGGSALAADCQGTSAWDGSSTTGAYYVDTTVPTAAVTVPSGHTLTLCLHGQALSFPGGFVVESGGTLNLYDCQGSGTLTNNHADGGSGVTVKGSGTFNMYSGTITGNKAQCGAGVHNAGTFNMSDGAIDLYNAYSTLELYGGKITGNTSSNSDGAIRVGKGTL
ncbi:MAG: hypothetical protein IJF65_07190 [Clostridia bacterium]|nr:hypothetical protein [Clostridia bacterium]